MAAFQYPPGPEGLYPKGTSFTVVIEEERKLRQRAEGAFDRRLNTIEERLFIIERTPDFATSYPELMKAFNKYKEEELKMKTFEALKSTNGS